MAMVNLTTVLALSALTSSAADFPPGLIVPQDLHARAAKQARESEPIVRLLRDVGGGRTLGPSPTLARWDWSEKIAVPVISQGSCGSCWACATAHCLSFQITIQTGRAANVSAQDILNCSGEGSCGGGWVAYNVAKTTGYADAQSVPYVGRKTTCARRIERPYRILTWSYLAQGGAKPTDSELRRALCEVGPVWVGIRADRALSNYRAGQVWQGPGGSINHAVSLVGWDDTKRAWIVRNSWGQAWGDRGNFLCAVGSNIGSGAAVAWASPSWVDANTAEQLQTLADSGCEDCEQPRIAGPEKAGPGTLVRLVAPELPEARYAWANVPAAALADNTYLDTGRRTLVIATPCQPGVYWFTCSVSRPDQDPLLLQHGLTVGDLPQPNPTPGPQPEPKPEPAPPVPPAPVPPKPTELDDFGRDVRTWAAEVPAASLAAAGEQIAAGFASAAEGLRAGKLNTIGEAQAHVRGKYSTALRGQVLLDWTPFFDRLTAAYVEHRDDLVDADLAATAAGQISAGIRAALAVPPPRAPAKAETANQTCPGGLCPAPSVRSPQRRRLLP